MDNKFEEPIIKSKTSDDTVEAEVWVVPDYNKKDEGTNNYILDQRITDLKMKIEALDDTIDRLENTADGVDYAIAAASGIIAGVLDSLFIGEFSLDKANQWGSEKTSAFVNKFAKNEGYTGDSFDGSMKYLSNKYDGVSYQPSMMGLILSVVTSVAGLAVVSNKTGYSFAEANNNLSVSNRLFRGIVDWGCNTVCSIKTTGKADGLPGPIQALLKKSANINTLECKQVKLTSFLNQSFDGTTKTGAKSSFNIDTELGALAQIGAQCVPVLINEVVVRAFYFIRRFFIEISLCNVKSIHDLYKIDWKATLPFGNRTIVRMLSVSTLAMSAVDMAGAAIESAMKSGGGAGAFFAGFALRLNYIGLGRTVIAIATDSIMFGKLSKKRQERLELVAEYLDLSKQKILYKQKDMWVEQEKTGEVIQSAVDTMVKTDEILKQSIVDNKESFNHISSISEGVNKNNPDLVDSIKDTIKWE